MFSYFFCFFIACPASWLPGDETIRTNPNQSKDYFKSHYAATP